jgi:hypothetical protein
MTTTMITVDSDFRCDAALPQPFGDPVLRCDRRGARYRQGRWVCPSCFALRSVRYVCGDRHEGRCSAMTMPQYDGDLPMYRCTSVGTRQRAGRLVCETHSRKLKIRFCDQPNN